MKQLIALLAAVLLSIGAAFGAVNVNTATQSELETLNGIGPSKAKAIIDYRTKNGPFKTHADLDKVPGIGEGTIGKIKADVTFSGPTTVTKAADKSKSSDKTAKADAKKDTKAEPKKDAKAEVKADAKAEPKKDVKADAKAEVKADAKKDVKADAKAEVKADTKAPVTTTTKKDETTKK